MAGLPGEKNLPRRFPLAEQPSMLQVHSQQFGYLGEILIYQTPLFDFSMILHTHLYL